jgi:arginyl-tRNA synthetase
MLFQSSSCLGLLAVGYNRYGSEEALASNAIMHLYEVYVKVNRDVENEGTQTGAGTTDEQAREVFRKMEDGRFHCATSFPDTHTYHLLGDEKTLALWRRFRELSIKKYEEVYARLNIQFDVYAGESLVSEQEIKHAMAVLHAKEMLTTKTAKESDSKQWKDKGPGTPASAQEVVAGPQASAAPDDLGLALAVDLQQWKLGKPVVQKPGESSQYHAVCRADVLYS